MVFFDQVGRSFSVLLTVHALVVVVVSSSSDLEKLVLRWVRAVHTAAV